MYNLLHAITPLKPHYDHTNITNEPIFPLNLTSICRLHDVNPVIYLLISYDLIFQESLAITSRGSTSSMGSWYLTE